MDDVRAFAGDSVDVPVIEPRATELLAHYDERALHYDTAKHRAAGGPRPTLGGMSGTDASTRDTAAEPFLGSQPRDMRPDLVIPDVWPRDERLWVPLSDGVWSRPLHFNVTAGQYTHLMRVTRAGIIARHRHTGPVFAHVLKGRWHYLEHDWVAEEGGFVFEPPGETHTLVVPDDVPEMITLFNVNGAMIYVDEAGNAVGFEDVHTKIKMCRAHYAAVGLGADYVDQFIR
jgi:quercetin dioxygenase-like cupin family protein